MKFFVWNKRIGAILIAILVLAGILRFYNLGEKSFSADEFLGVNASYGYKQLGEWRRWDFNLEKPMEDSAYFKTFFDFDFWHDGETTYTRAWIYNWQIAQSLKFLPDNETWSYRVVGVIWGIFSVLLIYWISFRFTGNRIIGLLAALLLTLSIDGIEFSRRVRMYAMFMPVFLIFAWVAFCFFESKIKSRWIGLNKFNKKLNLNFIFLIPVIFLGVLSMHLHLLAANFVFIALVYFIIMGIIEYIRTKKITNHYIVYSLGMVILGVIMNLKSNALLSSMGWVNHFSYLDKTFLDYSNGLTPLILIAIGGYYLIKNNKQREGVFLLTSYLIILLGAIFLWDRNSGEQYLFFAKSFQIILIASGIWAIANFFKENLKKYNQKVYWATMLFLLLAIINWGYFLAPENAYKQTSQSDNPNYKNVFSFVLSKKGTNDILITRNFRNFYWQGAQMSVISLGGERAEGDNKKITLNRLIEITTVNPSGWIIYSDNDKAFFSKDALTYIENNFKKIDNLKVRGPINVYYWNATIK
ncbi:MAG: hypothetical protein WC682_04295 [Parcubacteria group bacterium]|jgi:hypothetical protein